MPIGDPKFCDCSKEVCSKKTFLPVAKESVFDINADLLKKCKELIHCEYVGNNGYSFAIEDVAFDLTIKNDKLDGRFQVSKLTLSNWYTGASINEILSKVFEAAKLCLENRLKEINKDLTADKQEIEKLEKRISAKQEKISSIEALLGQS